MQTVEALLQFVLVDIDPLLRSLLFFAIGACMGTALCRWMVRLTEFDDETSSTGLVDVPASSRWWAFVPLFGLLLSRGRRTYRSQPLGGWGLLVEVGTGLLFAGFVFAVINLDCQYSPEVRPEPVWRYGRVLYHLVLIALLIAATGTDFREYVIPDQITLPGILIAVVLATASGQLQMVHLWTDWSQEMPELRGPYIPAWLDHSRHWHGLAWSLCGMAVGAGMTWLVRVVSAWMLGRPALGLGDVTLMAMIGSFTGWQPVLFVFLLAPLCGAVFALLLRIVTGTTFVPYGPYLSAAAVVVLFTWRWLWWPTRFTFGDATILAILGGVAAVAFVLLLGMIRVYRAIPGKRRQTESDPPMTSDRSPAESNKLSDVPVDQTAGGEPTTPESG